MILVQEHMILVQEHVILVQEHIGLIKIDTVTMEVLVLAM